MSLANLITHPLLLYSLGSLLIAIHKVLTLCGYYTGRFIMFSVITNICNKKTKGPTLMELFTATGKVKKFFFIIIDIPCVTRGAHIEHLYLSKKKNPVFLWL